MAEEGFPNRNRALSALDIYLDAMRGYVAQALAREYGADWIDSQVLNATAREHSPSSYERRLQSLQRGTPPRDLIDLAEIPFLIQDNASLFSDLDQSDTRRMQEIRRLRNEVFHSLHDHDVYTHDVDAIVERCALVLERCGLPAAAEEVRRLARTATDAKPTAADASSPQQGERERRG